MNVPFLKNLSFLLTKIIFGWSLSKYYWPGLTLVLGHDILIFLWKKKYHYLLWGGSKFILNPVFFHCLPEIFVPSDTFCKSVAACCIITWDWLSPQIADLNTVPSWPIFFSVNSSFYFFYFFTEAMGNILSCFLIRRQAKNGLAFVQKYDNMISIAWHFKVPP